MRRQINRDELSDFYRRIGAALWHVQHLENALVQFMTMKEIYELRRARKKVAEDTAWKLLDEHRKKLTVGPLIEICKRRKIIKKEDAARYEAFRNERHWLVHRSLIESGDDLYVEVTRVEVFRRIQAIEHEASELRNAVANDLTAWAASHGVNIAAAEKLALDKVRKLKGD
jgi:hypothetical protein